MLLCIDIGNTNIVMGLYEGSRLLGKARYTTSTVRTTDECGLRADHLVRRLHPNHGIDLDGVIICSVVPSVTPRMVEMSREYLDTEAVVVTADLDFGVTIRTDNPSEVGTDRLVNALSACRNYEDDCIIIDFGTATTFDVVSSEGEYLGGAIAPGVETGSRNLASRAAQLFAVDITPPKSVIGKSTGESMRSGIFWGQVEMINGMIVRIEDEFKDECTIIVTGGLGKVFVDYLDREATYDPDLTLDGLRLIYGELD